MSATGSNLETYPMLIGGEWVPAEGGEWLASDDPFRAEPWARIPRGRAADVDRAVRAAASAFREGPWSRMSPTDRGAALRRLADLVARDAEKLARLEARDNGKRFTEVLGQIRTIPQWYLYYGGLADKVEGAVTPMERTDVFNYTTYEPLGVVVAITPWNSPQWILSWKIGPALAAGNTVVIKPSEHASVSTLAFARLFEEAGFPAGVVNVVTGLGSEAGEALTRHPEVAKITFTGSDVGGQRVYEAAAHGMKRVTLELGGKSPQIVFADAPGEAALNGVLAGIFGSAGQSCVAGSRLLIERSIHDAFLARLADKAKAIRLGDPFDPQTHVGPMATRPQFEKVLHYLEAGWKDGARCLVGGERSRRPGCETGWFVEPTIFVDVTNDMKIAREEIFGPVLSVIPFDTEDEAVAIANDTAFGLAAGLWTSDLGRSFRMSRRLQSGTVYVNTYRGVSYVSPVGGYKRSGIGRENGPEAIKEFMQVKSVWLSTTGEMPNPFT